ncbi:aflatoxin biosynthesis ketoreductase nor-1 [Colletotrichum navitas]|uniref:Aflatoxin biosynthesis ketoreductase nor-1 n=1 Tax=Colletotrichum navitas TaxID=681940 RepID=A0AAD8V4A9_9PEZI|nr:aflatoxin biosynthesis ketoreductase nor-1 [Colletotrichum navitas]KAK1585700.1 aflatoxin biosynthesis ketoreductase nor-1 [Colletotrichum navitas]
MTSRFLLITGGNRGLGRELVTRFLEQENHTVIVAVRDPTHATSRSLVDLHKGDGSGLIVVKYDAAVEQDAFYLAKELREKHKVDHLDIVIANAAIATSFRLVKDVKREEIQEHINVNTYSAVSLYQATRDLLQKSTGKPMLVLVGSAAGSLEQGQPSIPNASYGAPKCILNWYGVRINAEDEWLNTFILGPGFTQTEMGNESARKLGMQEAPVRVEDCVNGMYQVITTATKEKHGGMMVSYTGEGRGLQSNVFHDLRGLGRERSSEETMAN